MFTLQNTRWTQPLGHSVRSVISCRCDPCAVIQRFCSPEYLRVYCMSGAVLCASFESQGIPCSASLTHIASVPGIHRSSIIDLLYYCAAQFALHLNLGKGYDLHLPPHSPESCVVSCAQSTPVQPPALYTPLLPQVSLSVPRVESSTKRPPLRPHGVSCGNLSAEAACSTVQV